MAKTIKPSALEDALSEQLTLYHRDILDRVNEAGERAAKALVARTKATVPKDSGDFKKAITCKIVQKVGGDKMFIWGAKSPKHRLTHLLVKGHATVNGGRVPGNPFLDDALDAVLPEYEREVEEALKNG